MTYKINQKLYVKKDEKFHEEGMRYEAFPFNNLSDNRIPEQTRNIDKVQKFRNVLIRQHQIDQLYMYGTSGVFLEDLLFLS